jgi:hypothetical protein
MRSSRFVSLGEIANVGLLDDSVLKAEVGPIKQVIFLARIQWQSCTLIVLPSTVSV